MRPHWLARLGEVFAIWQRRSCPQFPSTNLHQTKWVRLLNNSKRKSFQKKLTAEPPIGLDHFMPSSPSSNYSATPRNDYTKLLSAKWNHQYLTFDIPLIADALLRQQGFFPGSLRLCDADASSIFSFSGQTVAPKLSIAILGLCDPSKLLYFGKPRTPNYCCLATLAAANVPRVVTCRALMESAFPLLRTIETFDFATQTSINEPLMRELLRGEYIDNQENLLLVGKPT